MDRQLQDDLRELPVDGFIRFSIKAENTEKNSAIHLGFKAFAKMECNDDYTSALEKLLTYYQDEAKYESLWDNIRHLKEEMDELRIVIEDKIAKPEQDKDEEGGAF